MYFEVLDPSYDDGSDRCCSAQHFDLPLRQIHLGDSQPLQGVFSLCSIRQIMTASTILCSLSVAACAALSSSLGFDGSGSCALSGTSAHLCPGGVISIALGFGGGAGAAFRAGTTFTTG